MSYVKFLVALAALCVLIIPAFSMPNDGTGQDVNPMWQGQDNTQKTCDCQKPMMVQDDTQKYMCFGQDGKQKTCDCQKSMMGEDGKKMWQGQDGKDKTCDCQKSMMGEHGKTMDHKHIKSMMGNKGKEGNGEVKIVIINVNA